MQASHEEMDAVRANHVEAAFEDGESWQEASHRHGALFADLAQDYDSVLLIGHRATYVALEHLCKGVALSTPSAPSASANPACL